LNVDLFTAKEHQIATRNIAVLERRLSAKVGVQCIHGDQQNPEICLANKETVAETSNGEEVIAVDDIKIARR